MNFRRALPYRTASSMALSHSGDAIRTSLQETSVLAAYELFRNDLKDLSRHSLDYLRHDCIPKLLVCLGVRDRHLQALVEAHKTLALLWCEAPRVLSFLWD